MSLQAENEITANEVYFRLTSTMPEPTPSEHPSLASLPRDLHDDVTCTIYAVRSPVLRLD
jgi:hypothetical protein